MVTSFRMYGAVREAALAWRSLFERVFVDCGIDVQWIEHRWPEPIATLWQKEDLCCDFMCGWPFARSHGRMQAIAAPVPSLPRYRGLPRYLSEFLVRADLGWTKLEETFGHRFGWMAADSHSGFNAPRAHLSRFVTPERRSLYSEVRGPLGSPAKALEALRAGDIDVIALDGFFLDLCRRHDPARLEGLRTVAETDWAPIPLLVAAPAIDAAIVGRLREHLVAIHREAAYAPLLAQATLERFVVPDVAAYAGLESLERFAVDKGYEAIR